MMGPDEPDAQWRGLVEALCLSREHLELNSPSSCEGLFLTWRRQKRLILWTSIFLIGGLSGRLGGATEAYHPQELADHHWRRDPLLRGVRYIDL